MDRERRNLVLSLALAPLLPGIGPARADAAPIPLVAGAGAGPPAPPLRYGEPGPGPVLRVKRGAAVTIALRNALPGPTSLDLHGVRVPAPLGGGPLAGAVAPGAAAEVAFTPPDSGTFWFHPGILDPGEDATARGLAGVLLVEEPVPPDVDLDLVAVLSDRWPPADGPSGEPPAAEALAVDGGPWPRSLAGRPGSRVRLRLVNASTRRAVSATAAGARPCVVAIDGQPSELFAPLRDTVPIGPGARFDLVFDVPPVPGREVRLMIRGAAAAGPADAALVIRAEGDPRPPRGPVAPLPANPLLPPTIPLEASTRASLVATRRDGAVPAWAINGVPGTVLPKKPLFTTRRGSPVTLTFRNQGPELIAFRLHGFAMRLLHERDDGWEPYWRDSVLVPPGGTHHAAFLADQPGRWLIESPFFAQAAGGLRCWFEVA